MASGTNRIPCESTTCDSTSIGFNESSSPSSSLHSSYNAHTSPVEHSEEEKINLSLLSDPGLNNSYEDSSKKQPDTFNTKDAGSPPSYSTSAFQSENAVANYFSAGPQIVRPQDQALAALQPIFNLPVYILGFTTLQKLSLHLDPEVLPAQNWRSMAEYMEFGYWEIRKFEENSMRAKSVIEAWSRIGYHSVGELVDIIHDRMNRVDVITDIYELFLNDARRNAASNSRRNHGTSASSIAVRSPSNISLTSLPSSSSFTTCPGEVTSSITDDSFTTGVVEQGYSGHAIVPNMSCPVQVPKIETSAPDQLYDAFILCNISDKDFVVNQFLPKVEDEAKLKLCFAERDIPPGHLTFNEQMDFMFRRSRKLVVILSDAFFRSREHDWQSNFAISQDPASRKQSIIPVKYSKITASNIFDHLGCCDLTKTMKEEWFWNKIINGIKS